MLKMGSPYQAADLMQYKCLIDGGSKINRGWPFRSLSDKLITVKERLV
jgi:hypothetical protein